MLLDSGSCRGLNRRSDAEARYRNCDESNLAIYSRANGIVGVFVAETVKECGVAVAECYPEIGWIHCGFLEVLVHIVVPGDEPKIGSDEESVGYIESEVKDHIVLASACNTSVSLVENVAEPYVVHLVPIPVSGFVNGLCYSDIFIRLVPVCGNHSGL